MNRRSRPASFLLGRAFGSLAAFVAILGAAGAARADSMQDAAFVGQLYGDLLHRPASPAELDAGVLALASESRLSFATAQLGSQEYRQDVVGDLYQQFLTRSADSIELAGGVAALGAGSSDEDLAAGVLGGAEYFTNRGGSTNAGFLGALYGDLLTRPPTPGEDALWLSALGSGTTRQDIAASLLGSLEYDRDLVTAFYSRFLRRAPMASELDPLATSLNTKSKSDEQVIAALVSSDEYYALAQVPEPPGPLGTSGSLSALAALALRRRRIGP